MYDDAGGDPIFYFKQVTQFVEAAKTHALRMNKKEIWCPCKRCKNNVLWDRPETIREHLLEKGFIDNYSIWTKHGETGANAQGNDDTDVVHESHGGEGLDVEELLRNVAREELLENRKRGLDNIETMEKASNELLYDESKGCDKECTVLQTVLDLLTLKARNGWSDTSFNQLLQLLANLFPKPNRLPTSTYLAKKLLSPLTLGIQKIHACPNHCILYRKEHTNKVRCPTCNASRYKTNDDNADDGSMDNKNRKKRGRKKKKNTGSDHQHEGEEEVNERKIPALVMWYLPVIDRLKRLFSNSRDAKFMIWHAAPDGRKKDGKLRHPADARQWKTFDVNHPEFANDPRNVRLALSTDGMNPFGEMTNPHSTWPVILSLYNIPSWLCHKRKYLMLTTLISGPKQAGIDIDVFLEPLMEDMQKLWEDGVRVWDAYRQESFTLKAMIFVTINDNPARLTLTGQVKGKTGCVVCLDQTSSVYLPFSCKLVYMRHRRFLPKNHKYRGMTQQFDGKEEKELPPKHRDGRFVFEMVRNIHVVFGKAMKGKKRKKTEKASKDVPFKKQSIFYRYLPYWKELEIGHAIDTMHVAKGVFESTIGTLLDIPGKTKDGLSARRDLQKLGIRPQLHPQERPNGKYYLPPASFTLTLEEKKAFCRCLRGVRVPSGFSSNIKNLVSMSDLKMTGYNTHDCHTMLSLFLAIAIRVVNQPYVKMVVTRMCHFFNGISKKVIDTDDLEMLRKQMRETMCQLEMCFPLSFFDTMEHYMIHIADQIFVLGPVYLHHMYPYERYMSIMKGYVRNRAHPEGSMIEGYTTEEVLECYNDYMKDGKPIGVPVSRHEGRISGKGTKGRKTFNDESYERVREAHFSILHQLQIAAPYIQQHLQLLREENKDRPDNWIMKEHKRCFTTWLKDQNLPLCGGTQEKMMRVLAEGPSWFVTSWQAYDINGFTFYTKAKDMKSQHQNSGVRVDAEDSEGNMNQYYGYIDEIWELKYGLSLHIPIFKCQWVKHPQGVELDEYGFTLVDLDNVGHKDDPWILPQRVAQVFYVLEPEHEKKHVVIPGKQRIVGVENVTDEEEYNQFDEMPFFVDTKRMSIVETRISYSSMLPYIRTDGNGKLVQG